VVEQFEKLREAEQEDLAERSAPSAQIDRPAKLADTVASHLAIKIADKQDCSRRSMCGAAGEGVHLMEARSRAPGREAIRNRVKRQMEKTQREYYLNEQMKAIQKELGDGTRAARRDRRARREDRKHQAVEGSRDKALPS
jgi:ATP-dependent Lon protease